MKSNSNTGCFRSSTPRSNTDHGNFFHFKNKDKEKVLAVAKAVKLLRQQDLIELEKSKELAKAIKQVEVKEDVMMDVDNPKYKDQATELSKAVERLKIKEESEEELKKVMRQFVYNKHNPLIKPKPKKTFPLTKLDLFNSLLEK